MSTFVSKLAIAAAVVSTLGFNANAQQFELKNVAPNNVGPGQNNIGPGPSRCLAVTLAGSTFVRICNGGYSAQLGSTQCGGSAFINGGNYSLNAGNCNNGHQFLGGNLSCNGTICSWTPSPAGFAAGFRPEQVYAQYQ